MSDVEWADIDGFTSYSVSSNGDIRNKKSGKILRQHDRGNGYKSVLLYNESGNHRISTHRIVAGAFVPNPENRPQINHIDGDKYNNNSDNLEWCSADHNQQHRRNILKSGLRSVVCVETGIQYESIKQAAQSVDSHIPDIVRACKNDSTAKGLHWKYVKD